ncbi:MFS transporter [Nonomuraea sp. PA05]|uniref:MFS transporter n=1 Tax=Nonomuraea sp. PA05 TaxID=2604466 RepID=UPI0011D8485C|nr:MFS transporter [Nonomuraea sp. PA05]TYB57667.1 MFS transporter [Nonomuraea sp. PA05]
MTLLALITGVNAVGNGLYATISALYFTSVLGHSLSLVSAVLFAAMLAAMAADLAGGRLADTKGPRQVFQAGLIVSLAGMTAMLAAGEVVVFVLAGLLAGVGQGLCMSSNVALIRRAAGADAVMARATLRTFLTAGLALGGLAGAGVLAVGAPWAYLFAVAVNLVTFLWCALLTGGLDVPGSPANGGRRPAGLFHVYRDRRFMTFAVVSAFISVHNHVLPFAVPLWLAVTHPRLTWLAGIAMVVNTVLGVLLQIYANGRVNSGRGAVLSFLAGGVTIGASYLVFAWMARASLAVAVVLVLAFVVVYSLGEILLSAGAMDLQFRVVPGESQGQYSAAFGTLHGLASAAAPAVLGLVVASGGSLGWLVLAAATGLLAAAVLVVGRKFEFQPV